MFFFSKLINIKWKLKEFKKTRKLKYKRITHYYQELNKNIKLLKKLVEEHLQQFIYVLVL